MVYEILDPNPKRDNLQPVVECANGEEIGSIKPVDGKWEAHTNATARLSAPPMVFNSRDDAALAVYNEVQKHRMHAGEGDHALDFDAAHAKLLPTRIGVVSGVHFYEHPVLGDDTTLLAVVDGVAMYTSESELPLAEDVPAVIRDATVEADIPVRYKDAIREAHGRKDVAVQPPTRDGGGIGR